MRYTIMIGIATPTYDLNGVLVLLDFIVSASNFRDLSRRSTRTATLDGSAVLNDLGFSDSDRTITLAIKPTEDEESVLKNVVKFYSSVKLYIESDVFLANPQKLTYNRNGNVVLTLNIISKET